MSTLIKSIFRTMMIVIIISISAMSDRVYAVSIKPEIANPAIGQDQELTDPLELETFLDTYFAEQLSARHIPGATFVLVKDGETVFARGYGYADLENRMPYDPAETIFWAASITKIFSVVGVLQLYAKGLIHPEDDVNQHLVDFQIPELYGQPVTLHHLLTHTDGFEARIIGDAARTPSELKSLQAVVRENLPERIAPPGEFLTYGNYGINLSGVLVEVISGLPFAEYMETNIFRPLEMDHTTFKQALPPEWTSDLAVGYGYDAGAYDAKPFVHVASLPQGGGRSSAIDMAHFMIALLQGGRYGETRILTEEAVELMFQPQFSAHPSLGGVTYGLFEIYENDQRLLIRDGDGWGFRSRMVLIPDQDLGFFINYNNEDADTLREELLHEFVGHYFPDASPKPLAPRPDFGGRAEQFVGIYRPLQADESTFFKIALLFAQQIQVKDGGDGTLIVSPIGMGDSYGGFGEGGRWVETEPLLFRRMDGPGSLAFGRDNGGHITYLFSGQKYHGTYRKIAWYEAPGLHLGLLSVSAFFFLVTTICWPVKVWLDRRRGAVRSTRLPHPALWLAWTVCTLHLLFIAAVTVVMGNFVDIIYGVPPLLRVALALPVLAASLTMVQIALTVLAWRNKHGSVSGRMAYTLLTTIVLAFTWWLDYWNLLGFRYGPP